MGPDDSLVVVWDGWELGDAAISPFNLKDFACKFFDIVIPDVLERHVCDIFTCIINFQQAYTDSEAFFPFSGPTQLDGFSSIFPAKFFILRYLTFRNNIYVIYKSL